MISLTDIFEDMIKDFEKTQYRNSNILSRQFVLDRKIYVLISAYKKERVCEVGISIPDNFNTDTINNITKWKGLEKRINLFEINNVNKTFLLFKQLKGYDQKIFFIVMQDVIEAIKNSDEENVIYRIKETLLKWSTFFQFDREYILSENVQQGLYGELYILERMLKTKGEGIINCWTGCNAETHDFYCGKDAVEVKSSSTKGPDKIKISNEYQLDDTEIIGKLYLAYFKLKKSEIEGEKLPDIVNRISNILSESTRTLFYEKLLKVGYVYQLPELYCVHFKIRDEGYYLVKEGFPRITTKLLSRGIGAVEYVLSLDACNSFQITMEAFYEGIDL